MVHTCCTPLPLKERLFAEAKALGARRLRVDVELAGIFPAGPAAPRWRRLDELVALSRRHELPLLGIALGTPPWLSSCPRAADPSPCPPTDARAYGELVARAALRARGAVSHWQIGNEPDGGAAFGGSPESYAQVLSASYDALKRAAPELGVVLGGVMSPAASGWVGRVFATPGAAAARKFDVGSLHLRGTLVEVERGARAWRRLLAEHGFRGPLWITELGYPADPAWQRDRLFAGGDEAQARYLRRAVLGLSDAGAGELFVTLFDNLEDRLEEEHRSEGVVRLGPAPLYAAGRKPSFAALRELVDGWRWYEPLGWRPRSFAAATG